jgi:hypothetical protein
MTFSFAGKEKVLAALAVGAVVVVLAVRWHRRHRKSTFLTSEMLSYPNSEWMRTSQAGQAARSVRADPPPNSPPWQAGGCPRSWDPAAVAEAQALSSIGSLEYNPYAERRLEAALDPSIAQEQNDARREATLASMGRMP